MLHAYRLPRINNSAMNDIELLARIIQCEAGGEGDIGMRAVASVIMNRVEQRRGEYGRYNSLSDVIFAPRQFECATDQPQNLYNMSPEGIHYEIAQWALSGGRLTDTQDSLWFFNPYSATCRPNFPNQNGYLKTRIGNHCFYSPTSSYFNT